LSCGNASYGRSFRAPTLYENYPGAQGGAYIDQVDPENPSSPAVLTYFSPTPNLKAERARTIEAGLDLAFSPSHSGRVGISYFDIDFRNRIEELSQLGYYFGNVLTDQRLLGSLVVRNPTLSQVNAVLNQPGQQVINDLTGPVIPGNISAIANIGYVNAAVSHPRGINASAHYIVAKGRPGTFTLDASATYFLAYDQKLVSDGVPYTAANIPYNPTRFRGYTSITWDGGPFGAYGRLNYSSGYHNPDDPNCLGRDGCPVASYPVFNAGVSYTTRSGGAALHGLRVGVDVANLFARHPPYVYTVNTGGRITYDPTNALINGRTISLTVGQRF
jgi:iron complex outermembrane recepter protein